MPPFAPQKPTNSLLMNLTPSVHRSLLNTMTTWMSSANPRPTNFPIACIGEAKVHDEEIEGAVAGSEGGLPVITGSNADKVVSSMEVDLGEDV